jgi:hypothetical protein
MQNTFSCVIPPSSIIESISKHPSNFVITLTIEPVAKPLVLQIAGGVKLRPTKADFGVNSYESTNYSNLAEDGENEHDQTKMPNCEHFDWETRVLNVPISCIRSVSAGYRERSGAVVR